MTKPTNITILPELAAWFRNHTPEEAAKFEHNLKTAGTILDSIKWARITLDDGKVVETPLDGHQRFMACQRYGIPIPDDKWELIETVTTIRQARKWMRDWQFGRRNWSPNEMALQAAQEYEEEKLVSGARTDLHGKKVDTAKAVAARYGKTDRWVREAVAFANAVNEIKDNVGIDFPAELIQDEKPALTRDQIVAIAQAPDDVQREALELVKKRNAAGVTNLLQKAQRRIEGTGHAPPIETKPTVSKFDLSSLVYSIDTWSMEMVRGYNPVSDVRAASYLSTHLPSALEKLIVLAEENGLAGDVLDAYVTRRLEAMGVTLRQARQEAPQGGDAALPARNTTQPAVAAPEPPAAEREANGDAGLRERLTLRLQDRMGSTGMASVAAEIGVAPQTLKCVLDGNPMQARTRAKVKAWLDA
jgi:hypothetical protein